MKALFTTLMLASAVIAAPAFAGDAQDVLGGTATVLSNSEMKTTVGGHRSRPVRPVVGNQCCNTTPSITVAPKIATVTNTNVVIGGGKRSTTVGAIFNVVNQ